MIEGLKPYAKYTESGNSMILHLGKSAQSVDDFSHDNPCVSMSSVQSVFYRNPSAFIRIHLRLIFVSLSDRTRKIKCELVPIINENGLTESPQSPQRAQSFPISVAAYEKAAASRFRTRITRIARIYRRGSRHDRCAKTVCVIQEYGAGLAGRTPCALGTAPRQVFIS
jgi:hypothetical protein